METIESNVEDHLAESPCGITLWNHLVKSPFKRLFPMETIASNFEDFAKYMNNFLQEIPKKFVKLPIK